MSRNSCQRFDFLSQFTTKATNDVNTLIKCYVSFVVYVCAQVPIDSQDQWGSTGLMHAAHMMHMEIVKLLIEHAADINKQDNRGITTLMEASWNRHLPVVELLVITQSQSHTTLRPVELYVQQNNNSTPHDTTPAHRQHRLKLKFRLQLHAKVTTCNTTI